LVRQIRRGYDGIDENPNLVRWTIPSALMYCITIYTTIGSLLASSAEFDVYFRSVPLR
jgi:hypothetical protein